MIITNSKTWITKTDHECLKWYSYNFLTTATGEISKVFLLKNINRKISVKETGLFFKNRFLKTFRLATLIITPNQHKMYITHSSFLRVVVWVVVDITATTLQHLSHVYNIFIYFENKLKNYSCFDNIIRSTYERLGALAWIMLIHNYNLKVRNQISK